jgi:osmoprotectant transport system ATP-binding protein
MGWHISASTRLEPHLNPAPNAKSCCMNRPAPLIAIEHVAKSHDGGRTFALRDVTLHVEAGTFLAMVGASGAGKTTLMKCINRLVEPDSGSVHVDGKPVSELDAPTLRRSIGYVFQGIGLFPHMSVAENIGITPQLLGWSPPDIMARTRELLALVELPQTYSTRMPAALSGGEQQRVAVARAIAARPRIVLMDEPFGALDPLTRDTIGTAYRALHERLALTTVMVTHDMQDAILLADRITVMSAGHIVANDTPISLMGSIAAADTPPEVAALLAMPKRRAERISAIMTRDTEATGRSHE